MPANTATVPIPAHHCPLCGGPNGCAPARSGSFATPCWCQAQPIDAQARARVPVEQRGKACLCPRCGIKTERSRLPSLEALVAPVAPSKSEPGQEST